MSVSRHTTSRPARVPRSSIASARMRASCSVFMNAPSPTFTSSTIASAPAAIFFDMKLAAEAWDRLELVQGAAGVTETAAAHLPEGNAAGRDDRADGDRRLVADAARGMLVDDAAPELGGHVHGRAAPDERLGHRERLLARQSTEHHRHAERRHLVVGHVTPRVAEHELAQLIGVERAAVPLALDQLRRVDRHGVTMGCPGMPRRGGLPPSHAFTVAPTSPNSPSCRAPFA